MMQNKNNLRPRTRLVIKRQIVRELTLRQLALVAGGETTSGGCSMSDCPWCERQ